MTLVRWEIGDAHLAAVRTPNGWCVPASAAIALLLTDRMPQGVVCAHRPAPSVLRSRLHRVDDVLDRRGVRHPRRAIDTLGVCVVDQVAVRAVLASRHEPHELGSAVLRARRIVQHEVGPELVVVHRRRPLVDESRRIGSPGALRAAKIGAIRHAALGRCYACMK